MIYILGHKGFVGSAIERFLQKNSIDYRGINRDNYDSMKGTSCNIFINAAGSSTKWYADKNPSDDFQKNVSSIMNTVNDFNFNKYILISSVVVYNDVSDPTKNQENASIDSTKLSNYGFHKWLGECIVEKHCKKWLILRLCGMVGQGLKKNPIFDILERGSLFVHPESRYQYINTDDVAKILWMLKDKENDIFNICGNGTVKLQDIADSLGIKLPKENYSLNKEVYDINVDKLKALVDVPETKDTLLKFCKTRGV